MRLFLQKIFILKFDLKVTYIFSGVDAWVTIDFNEDCEDDFLGLS